MMQKNGNAQSDTNKSITLLKKSMYIIINLSNANNSFFSNEDFKTDSFY